VHRGYLQGMTSSTVVADRSFNEKTRKTTAHEATGFRIVSAKRKRNDASEHIL